MIWENIECPHCLVTVHVGWDRHPRFLNRDIIQDWSIVVTVCPNCNELIARIVKQIHDTIVIDRFIQPQRRNRPAINSEAVPTSLRNDYLEACEVLEVSPKASAVLSRRILQGILKAQGYESINLYKQITDILNETGPHALPMSLRDQIDVIRQFGNFSAHPITEQTTLQVVDIEPGEAEWCLEIIEELFIYYYVEPARRKRQIEATRSKLREHGKQLLPRGE